MTAAAPVYPPLVLVEWVDATNIGAWHDLSDIPEFAADGAFICRNVGYLVHEDDECVVLAARISLNGDPKQVGLFERIPKGIIRERWVLADPRSRTSCSPRATSSPP